MAKKQLYHTLPLIMLLFLQKLFLPSFKYNNRIELDNPLGPKQELLQQTWSTTLHLLSTRTSTATYFQTTTDNHRPRALLVVIGAFTCLFCTVGFLNSSGVFIEYYTHEQLSTESPSTIAWLGAISIFFLFALSPGVGALLDVFGPKVSSLHTWDCHPSH
jgi:hypothetical protein